MQQHWTATSVGTRLRWGPVGGTVERCGRHHVIPPAHLSAEGARETATPVVVVCLSHDAHVANKGKMDLLTVVVDSPLSQPFVFFLLFSVFS
jgi:hypothetical protein